MPEDDKNYFLIEDRLSVYETTRDELVEKVIYDKGGTGDQTYEDALGQWIKPLYNSAEDFLKELGSKPQKNSFSELYTNLLESLYIFDKKRIEILIKLNLETIIAGQELKIDDIEDYFKTLLENMHKKLLEKIHKKETPNPADLEKFNKAFLIYNCILRTKYIGEPKFSSNPESYIGKHLQEFYDNNIKPKHDIQSILQQKIKNAKSYNEIKKEFDEKKKETSSDEMLKSLEVLKFHTIKDPDTYFKKYIIDALKNTVILLNKFNVSKYEYIFDKKTYPHLQEEGKKETYYHSCYRA